MEKASVAVSFVAIALALGAGFVMAVQPAVNAKLASQCSHPLQASLISFATGTLALFIIAMVLGAGLPQPSNLRTLPWWAWLGGLCGTYMVTVSLMVAPDLGATRWIALVLAGQILLSLVLDHYGLIGYAKHPINGLRILGVILTALGVSLVMRN